MTFARREELLSQESLSVDDLAELMAMSYQTAAKVIRQIRFKHDRLGIQGRIHIQDYIEYFNLPAEKYSKKNFEMDMEEVV